MKMDVNMYSRISKLINRIYPIFELHSLKVTSKKLLYIKLANKDLRLGVALNIGYKPPFELRFLRYISTLWLICH